MTDDLKRSEAELSELLNEYWALRNRTCEWMSFRTVTKGLRFAYGSRIHRDYSQETGDAGLVRLRYCLSVPCSSRQGCLIDSLSLVWHRLRSNTTSISHTVWYTCYTFPLA
jgi:hypothetical protein